MASHADPAKLLCTHANHTALVGSNKGALHGELLLDEFNDLYFVLNVLHKLALDVYAHSVAIVLQHLFRLIYFFDSAQVVRVPLVEVAFLGDC